MVEKKKVRLYSCIDQLYDLYGSIKDYDVLMMFREEQYDNLRHLLEKSRRSVGGLEDTEFGEEIYFCAIDFKKELENIQEPKQKIKKLEVFINYMYSTYDFDTIWKTYQEN